MGRAHNRLTRGPILKGTESNSTVPVKTVRGGSPVSLGHVQGVSRPTPGTVGNGTGLLFSVPFKTGCLVSLVYNCHCGMFCFSRDMKAVTVPIEKSRRQEPWGQVQLAVWGGAGDTLDSCDSPGTRVSALYLRPRPVVRPSLQQGLGSEGLS